MAALDVFHPLLGATVPTLEMLHERAEARARESLEFAARLASHRIFEQRQLRQKAEKLDAPPWSGPATRVRTHPETLLPSDLLRAFLVSEPERIAGILAEDLRGEAYSAVVSALGSWSGPARRPPPRLDDFELQLDPAWARRFALAEVRHGRQPLTVPSLFSALGLEGLEGLAAFSKRCMEGGQSPRDVALRFVQRSPRDLGQRLHQAVPPAYVDRHGGLAAIEAALGQAPGVLVVGERHTGRSELLRAWVRRVTANGARPDWEGRLVVVDPQRAPGKLAPGACVGLTARPRGEAAGGEGPDDARLRWLGEHAGQLGASGLRVVAVVESAALSQWLEAVPELAAFARVEVPPIDPRSLAAIWLAHTIARPGLGLVHVLEALGLVGLEAAASIDPWALDQLVRPAGLLSCYDADDACRVVTAGASGRVIRMVRDSTPLARGVEPWLLEALGGPAGLEVLQGLEGRLRLDG